MGFSQSRVFSTEAELRREYAIIAIADTSDDGQRYLTVEFENLVAFHYLSEGKNAEDIVVLRSYLLYYSVGAFNNKMGQIVKDYYQKSSDVWIDYRSELPVLIEKIKLEDRYVVGYSIDFNEED